MKSAKKYLVFNIMLCFIGYSIPMGILLAVIFVSFIKGMVLGAFSGLLFTILMSAFGIYMSRKKDEYRELYGIDGEILYDGEANHWVGAQAVGGWIFLKEDMLCFVPHKFNLIRTGCNISYTDIKNVKKGSRIRSIGIHLQNGQEEQFVVNNRKEWIRILKKLCSL